MLADSFSEYAQKYPKLTASIIEKMLHATETDSPNPELNGLEKAVSLLLVLPESAASDVIRDIRCLTDPEREPLTEHFIFEMARVDSFDPHLFSEAVCEFAGLEAMEPHGGIDRARILTEPVFTDEKLIRMINHLTEMLKSQDEDVAEGLQ
jgi:flagellar motor switch protein FliG